MFGISFTEILLILAVALVVVGPQKLPRVLGTLGNYIGKLRRLATEMRRQTGIDEILRQEGLEGGINELRNILRTEPQLGSQRRQPYAPAVDESVYEYDRSREYPTEGADCYSAIPEDLAQDLLAGSEGPLDGPSPAIPVEEHADTNGETGAVKLADGAKAPA